jgi:uncharacterized repeat protein (TIGR03803 family)
MGLNRYDQMREQISLTNSISLVGFIIFALVSVGFARDREKTLYTFPGGSRGDDPQAGVVSDSDGNLYGTTYYGGLYGWGTVFELKHSQKGWTHDVLCSFQGSNDGFNPSGNLLIDKAGNLYGTTFYGGSGSGCENGSEGCGTVYELKRAKGGWEKAILYDLCSVTGCPDGSNPYGLIFDKAGNIYGTAGGGVGCDYGCGVVYELTPSNGGWIETVLHEFTDTNGDGDGPGVGVSIDEAGNLYGTTCCGGVNNYGIVFELKRTKHMWNESILYSFTGNGDGGANGGLVLDDTGNIYGTTNWGTGCQYGCGTVFELTRSHGQWVEKVFFFNGTTGESPIPGLVRDSQGNLYGVTSFGGGDNDGVVFKLEHVKQWKITVLHTFSGKTDGANPEAGLTFGLNNNLFGTTSSLYDSQYGGTVFQISP